MVERITGQTSADAAQAEIRLVMTDRTLFAGDQAPAHVDGYGPIPAATARQIVRAADRAWVRRLFASPDGSALVAMDSRRRVFGGELRRFVIVRDEVCRTPSCDAPIRHVDHVVRVADNGETTSDNAQGLCETCNYTKEATRWRAERPPGPQHVVQVTTPTGQRHQSRAPAPPGHRVDTFSPGEHRLRAIFEAA